LRLKFISTFFRLVMNRIDVTSINIRGLCDQAKRSAFYEYIRQKQFDVIFVQETHMCDDETIQRAKKQWSGTSHWIKGEPNSKGVAILFRKGMDVKLTVAMDAFCVLIA
jgi:exonuclease III